MEPIVVTVHGTPESQGSKTPIRRGNRIMLIEGTGTKPKRLKDWRDLIRTHLPVLDEPIDQPVCVELQFMFIKPKSVKHKTHVDVKPDLDKLTRAVLDSLTIKDGVGVLKDDARVAQLICSKVYSDEAGVVISITGLEHETVS